MTQPEFDTLCKVLSAGLRDGSIQFTGYLLVKVEDDFAELGAVAHPTPGPIAELAIWFKDRSGNGTDYEE